VGKKLRSLLTIALLLAIDSPPARPAYARPPAAPVGPDIRFILQTQAGLTAYTQLTNTLSLAFVRPLFTSIAFETPDYIAGRYTLAGRSDQIGLAIGSAGWAVAYHDRATRAEKLFDCRSDPAENSLLEKALQEISQAIGLSAPINFYDYRTPHATGLLMHWLYLPGSGTQQSTINLPLSTDYLERGYYFCTAISNSKFYINDELIDQQNAVTQIIRRAGSLTPEQLRAGQTSTLKINALTIFGSGFYSGVSVVYSGTISPPVSGGYTRAYTLTYPLLLGQPITLTQTFFPAIRK